MEEIKIILSGISAFALLILIGITFHKFAAFIGQSLKISELLIALWKKIF